MSEVKKSDFLTKYIVGDISRDIKNNILNDLNVNYDKYTKGQVMQKISKLQTLEFIISMSSPYVSADWDIAEAISYVGIDNCLRYLRSFCQKYNSSAFDLKEVEMKYNLRFDAFNTDERVSGKAGSFSNEWFSHFGVYGNNIGFDSLTTEQQQSVWEGFRDSLFKMNDTLNRIVNDEPGFLGLPQYEGLSEEKVLKGLEQLVTQCDNLIYKMGAVIESNSDELSGPKKI